MTADSSQRAGESWHERLGDRYSHWIDDPFWNAAEQRPRAIVRLGGAICVISVVIALTSILAGLIARVSNLVLPEWIAKTVLGGIVVGLGPQIMGAGAIVLGIGIAAVVLDRRQISDLGVGHGWSWVVDCVFGCLLGLGIATGAVAIDIAAGWTTITGVLTGAVGQQVALYVCYFFIFYLCVGIREEIIFRGYLLPNIAEGLCGVERLDTVSASWGAVALTALLFIGWHWGSPLSTLVTAGLFGIVFGVAYLLTDSIAIPIGLHTTWNLAVLALYGPPTIRTGGKLVEIASEPVGIVLGITTIDLVSWGMIGVGLILIVAWVRLREEELRVQPGISVPTFHDSHVGRQIRAWFDVHSDESIEEPRIE